jgi:hypothetical protein
MICEPGREPSRLMVRRRGCSAAARGDGTVIATGSNDHGWPGRLIPRWANRDAALHPLPKERQCLGRSPRIPKNDVMSYPSRPVLEVMPQFRGTASVRQTHGPALKRLHQDLLNHVPRDESGHIDTARMLSTPDRTAKTVLCQ